MQVYGVLPGAPAFVVCGDGSIQRALENFWGARVPREAGSCPDENSLRLGDLYVVLVVGSICSICRKKNCPEKRRGWTDSCASVLQGVLLSLGLQRPAVVLVLGRQAQIQQRHRASAL